MEMHHSSKVAYVGSSPTEGTTQENYSIHGKPTGKAERRVCGGKGTVVKR